MNEGRARTAETVRSTVAARRPKPTSKSMTSTTCSTQSASIAGELDAGTSVRNSRGSCCEAQGSTDADGARAASLDVVVEHSGAPNSPKPVRRRTGCASMGYLDIVRETAGAPQAMTNVSRQRSSLSASSAEEGFETRRRES